MTTNQSKLAFTTIIRTSFELIILFVIHHDFDLNLCLVGLFHVTKFMLRWFTEWLEGGCLIKRTVDIFALIILFPIDKLLDLIVNVGFLWFFFVFCVRLFYWIVKVEFLFIFLCFVFDKNNAAKSLIKVANSYKYKLSFAEIIRKKMILIIPIITSGVAKDGYTRGGIS